MPPPPPAVPHTLRPGIAPSLINAPTLARPRHTHTHTHPPPTAATAAGFSVTLREPSSSFTARTDGSVVTLKWRVTAPPSTPADLLQPWTLCLVQQPLGSKARAASAADAEAAGAAGELEADGTRVLAVLDEGVDISKGSYPWTVASPLPPSDSATRTLHGLRLRLVCPAREHEDVLVESPRFKMIGARVGV